MRKTYLVCYDICDDRRLHKVHKTMRGFGDRLQYSVFECQLTAADLTRCRHRLSGLIDEWVEGLFVRSADTLDGAHRHERHDRREDKLPEAGDAERIHARSVTLASDAHGVIAKLDLIEGSGSVVTPVGYKRGAPKDMPDGPEAWPADRAQLVVQALILREHGYTVHEALAYYYETKQRVRLAVDDALVAETVTALGAARAIAASGRIPPPLVDSPKCPRCSLVGICLPDETRRAMASRSQLPDDSSPCSAPAPRRRRTARSTSRCQPMTRSAVWCPRGTTCGPCTSRDSD